MLARSAVEKRRPRAHATTAAPLSSGRTFARVPPPPVRWASLQGPTEMAKGYWVSCYRSITNPDAVAAYAKLAGPAIMGAGGRFLARGNAAKVYEAGIMQRIV